MRKQFLILGLMVFVPACGERADPPGQQKQQAAKLPVFSDANFAKEVLESKMPVLVDFYADWCGPCRIIGPAVEELAVGFAGDLKFGKLDVDAAPETANQYQVRSIPTLILFRNGQEINRLVGLPKGDAKSAISEWVLQSLKVN